MPAVTAVAFAGSALMLRRIWCLESKLESNEEMTLTSRLRDRMKQTTEKARLDKAKRANVDKSLAEMQAMID